MSPPAQRVLQQELGGEASARSQPYYVDVTHPKANKGFVVDYLSRHLGIPTGEIVTIGDMPNDVLMFKETGFSIAKGNASAAVQREADVVTASHNDEGFAKAIERYLLDGRSEEGPARPPGQQLRLGPRPPSNIHPLATFGLSPAEAAAAYERTLKVFYGAETLDEARAGGPGDAAPGKTLESCPSAATRVVASGFHSVVWPGLLDPPIPPLPRSGLAEAARPS